MIPEDDVSAALLALGSAVLGSCGASILPRPPRAVWGGAGCAGPARTARCAPGDNLAVHVAVGDLVPGEVLVVQVLGEPHRGYWGEVLTTAAQAAGGVGLVIDAGVRDTDALAARRFPVFSAGVALADATKVGPGAVDVTVALGGAAVRPGDLVVADGDGVVVVDPAEADDVVAGGRQRVRREAEMLERLATGATTISLLGLDEAAATIERGDG